MSAETYTFTGLDEFYETAELLPEVTGGHAVYGHHEARDQWDQAPYKEALYTDDGRLTGIVSASDDFYHIIQYGDILEAVGTGVEQHQDRMDVDVAGRVSVSPTAHKMSARVDFEGEPTVYAAEDDPLTLGLKVRSGHSGFHGLKYDVGGYRPVCSNGVMAFHSDLHFEQSHGQPFQPGLAYNAVDAVIESPAVVEERIERAQDRALVNRDEALLVLLDLGIDRYLDNAVADLVNALHAEVDDPEAPTLWETYNAATRALTHYAGDVPEYELDRGYERAARLLETGQSAVPEPDRLGQEAVERRVNQYVEGDEVEPYWEGEEETLHELMALHGAA